ncbi:hypothetical protein [Jeotgalibaca arthritidis]
MNIEASTRIMLDRLNGFILARPKSFANVPPIVIVLSPKSAI